MFQLHDLTHCWLYDKHLVIDSQLTVVVFIFLYHFMSWNLKYLTEMLIETKNSGWFSSTLSYSSYF